MSSRVSAKGFFVSFLTILLSTSLILALTLSVSFADGGDVTRDNMIDVAESYSSHVWTPHTQNIFHGTALDGLRVETPNEGYVKPTGGVPGWWIPDMVNTGIPYQWGGFSSLSDFGEGISEGKAGGDIWTHFDEGVASGKAKWRGSKYACGVDCSGLASRSWNLSSHYSTKTLLNRSQPIKFEDLRPGDILNSPRISPTLGVGHVMVFKEFLNNEKTELRVYEASGRDWRVSERTFEVAEAIDDNPPASYDVRTGEFTFLDGDGYGAVLTPTGSTQTETYWAYIYNDIASLDVILLIDRSGSMGRESKMESAKEAAKMFVDRMKIGDKIGVVDFDDEVTVTYELTEIDPGGTVKIAAKNAIDTLYDRGRTSIGGGLEKGQDELNTRGASDPVRVMVLLSDGLENEPPYVADVLPGVIDDGMIVHTIGLGSDADEVLLKEIVDQTGGTYHFSPGGKELQEIYNSVSGVFYNEETLKTPSGEVMAGDTSEKSVLVDSTVDEALFTLTWLGSDLDLTLVQPDGTVITPTVAEADRNISFVESTTYEIYRVDAPLYGEWRLRIYGKSTPPTGEEYELFVSATSAMIFSVGADKEAYSAGEPIRIEAAIGDSYLDADKTAGVDRVEGERILGAAIEVTAEDPAQNSYSFQLYDDGHHGDEEADDGLYANTFTNTSLLGSYNFTVRVSGVNNRHAQPFTREFVLSTVVTTSPVRKVYLPLILKNYPPDTTPPAAVTNLSTSNPTLASITLNWTAPGDDGNTGTAWKYDVRYSTWRITDANWNAAARCVGEPDPQPAGSNETFVVNGLSPNTTYYFALKTADEVPQWSGLSNVASGATLHPDTTPPAAVTNLSTSNPTLDSITLNWTAPGDDSNIGAASEYDIRYSTSSITDANWETAAQCVGEPDPQPAGSSETFTVNGLSPNTTYYFALKRADEVPQWSDLSSVASGTTLRPSDQLIINCGFETDEGWVFGESPRPAAYTTEDAHWGARSVRLGIKPPTTDAYSWSSVRQRITIPANARSATLSFWYKPFTECTCRSNWQRFDWSGFNVDQPSQIPPDRNPRNWASCDWQQALILADDFPNPTILATLMNINSNSGVWTHKTFDLMPFAGQTIWVYFNVYNDGWGSRRTWMYVDDASVMVYY